MHVTLLGGGFGASPSPIRRRGGALRPARRGGRCKVVWTREDEFTMIIFTRFSGASRGRPRCQGRQIIAWLHRSVLPTLATTFGADPKTSETGRAGRALYQCAVCYSQYPRRDPAREPAPASAGSARSPMSRRPSRCSFRGRAGRGDRARPEGSSGFAGPHWTGAHPIDPLSSIPDGWNHGESPKRYPVDTGRLRRVD